MTLRHPRFKRCSALRLPLSLILLILLASHQTVTAQSVQIDRVIPKLEPEIHRAMIEGKIPSCTIALVEGERVIWTGAYGYSNLWSRTPAVPSTVYLIGSTFKAMATVALLKLLEQGKFKLDDRVNDYLTDFKIQNENPTTPVTFRHLFAHVSGLPADFGAIGVGVDSRQTSLSQRRACYGIAVPTANEFGQVGLLHSVYHSTSPS